MTAPVYLDYNATTPLAPEVVKAMLPYLEEAYGNPSSLHWAGLPARDAIEVARSQVAALLCCDATEIVFTSGGTEASNHAIKGLFFSRRASGRPFHVITSGIEHPAILEPCRFIEELGAEITRLPVDRFGLVDPDDIRHAIRPSTALISVMYANNEVGTIQPITEIARIAHEHGVLCHTDAAQTVGKIETDVESLGVDLLSVAGHKLYGPKGVGALFVREGVTLDPILHGAGHEAGRRAGTENVLQIVGLGAACERAQDWIDDTTIRQLRDDFWQRLQQCFGERIVLNGHPEFRLPNTLNVSFAGERAIVIDLLLLSVFAVQHSVMARPLFKRWWTTIIPGAAERSTYVLASSLLLFLLFWQWRPLPDLVWKVAEPAWAAVLWSLFGLGWLIVLISTFLINHFDLFGLRQVYLQFVGRPYTPIAFQSPWLYRVVRNPIMVGFLIAFWATPTMSQGHLLFAAVVTAYVIVALQLEERDLVHFHGDSYSQYQREVSMLLPLWRSERTGQDK